MTLSTDCFVVAQNKFSKNATKVMASNLFLFWVTEHKSIWGNYSRFLDTIAYVWQIKTWNLFIFNNFWILFAQCLSELSPSKVEINNFINQIDSRVNFYSKCFVSMKVYFHIFFLSFYKWIYFCIVKNLASRKDLVSQIDFDIFWKYIKTNHFCK